MTQTRLVNRDHPIKEKDQNKLELVKIKNKDQEEIQVEKEAYEHFKEFQKFLKKQGIEIEIDSAYRGIEEQKKIEKEYFDKYGRDYCNQFVAPPGCSEHHTGLAIDFYIKKDGKYPLDDKEVLENPSDYEDLHKYLKDYGFILRFPKGKEKITGYSYEPWHIRYVGNPVATLIDENNLTLEEYLTTYGGVLVIKKEKGCTSYDVVDQIKKTFGIQRVGHTGTLDPLAEGVLVVCIGTATKTVELLTASEKEYIATAKLGVETDTYDIEGKILKRKEVGEIALEKTLSSFQKTYLQEVPIYSAVKVDGKKLYEYARKEEKVELPKKEVTIKEIELLEKTKDTFQFRAVVSKGCYIRSLIHEIGISLGTYATMTSLVRTRQGKISLEEAKTIKEVQEGNFKIKKIEETLPYPVVEVEESLAKDIKNGKKIPNNWNIPEKVMIRDSSKKLLGIYEVEEDHLRVWKNFR